MKIDQLICPACGAKVDGTEGTKICPYCQQPLFVDDDSQKVTFKKVDEARIKEAEAEEKIRLRELDLRESEMQHRQKKDERQQKLNAFKIKAIVIGSVALAVILAFVITLSVMKAKSKLAALEAYQQGIRDNAEQMEKLQVNKEVAVDSMMLSSMIEPASELVSYKYYYTSAGVYEDSKKWFGSDVKVPFSTDKAVFLVDGVISAGIDIDKVTFDVDNEKKIISVSLPEPGIISHEIDSDSFQYFDVKNSIFNSSDLNDYAELETSLKDQQEEKLLANEEFWEKAKSNIKTTLSSLINASGIIDDYQIKYTWY